MLVILSAVYGLAGAAAITFGIWQIYQPGAFIFAGAFVVLDSWRLSNFAQRAEPTKDAE